MSVRYMHTVPMEARRRHQVPWVELYRVVSHHIGAGNQTLGPLQKVLIPEPSLQTLDNIYFHLLRNDPQD